MTNRFRRSAIVILGLLCLVISITARAQDTEVSGEGVEADLSTHEVGIETNFAGAVVQLFGAVVNDEARSGQQPDVLIVVRGPARELHVRQKKNVGGLWVNDAGLKFTNVPGYYAIVANRPVADIASSYTLKSLKIGFNSLKASLILSDAGFGAGSVRDYADAAVRIMKDTNLYQEHIGGISFSGKHLFRAKFELPSNVPIGKYTADVFLFQDGKPISRYKSSLVIEKRGIEEFIYDMAHNHALIYGILSVLAAMAAGMSAAWAFSRN